MGELSSGRGLLRAKRAPMSLKVLEEKEPKLLRFVPVRSTWNVQTETPQPVIG